MVHCYVKFVQIEASPNETNCGGQLIPYVQIALERAGPNTQSYMYKAALERAGPNTRSEDKRVSEDDQ